MKFNRILFLIPFLLLISSQIVSASYMLEKEEQATHPFLIIKKDTHGPQGEGEPVHDLAEGKEVEEELKKEKERQSNTFFIYSNEVNIHPYGFYSSSLSRLKKQTLLLQKNLQVLYCSFLI